MRTIGLIGGLASALLVAAAAPVSAAVIFGEQRGTGKLDTFECFDTGMSTYCSQYRSNVQTPSALMPGVDYTGNLSGLAFTSAYTADSVALSLAQGPYSGSYTVLDASTSWSIDIELTETTIIQIVGSHLTGYPSSSVGIRENCSFADCTASTPHSWSLGSFNDPPLDTSIVIGAGLHRLYLVAGFGGGYAANTATFTLLAVPEPTTVLLVGAGLLALGLTRRRASRSQG